MAKRPQDLLEFLRRSGESGPAAARELEKTPRMLVVRRSQAVLVAAAAGLALVLTFLVGLALGDNDAPEQAAGGVGVWVIRVVSYEDNDKGRRYAKTVMSRLERLDLGDEVNLRRITSGNTLVVTIGSWLRAPMGNRRAEALLTKVKQVQERGGSDQPFASANFWRIER